MLTYDIYNLMADLGFGPPRYLGKLMAEADSVLACFMAEVTALVSGDEDVVPVLSGEGMLGQIGRVMTKTPLTVSREEQSYVRNSRTWRSSMELTCMITATKLLPTAAIDPSTYKSPTPIPPDP